MDIIDKLFAAPYPSGCWHLGMNRRSPAACEKQIVAYLHHNRFTSAYYYFNVLQQWREESGEPIEIDYKKLLLRLLRMAEIRLQIEIDENKLRDKRDIREIY